MSQIDEAAEQPAGIPWIAPEIQERIRWRDGDVVISVPAKSGTTWTMNIVHQLLTGGRDDFVDIYAQVPWIEFLSRPGKPIDEVLEQLEAMPEGQHRAFKTHSAPPVLPYIAPGEGPDVKYIAVFRNPEEALVSFMPFIAKHTDEWYALWDMPREALCRDDFTSFYDEVIAPARMDEHGFFGFLNAWWPHRFAENVLFMHFSDMKRDHEGSIRKIAAFLDIELTESEWDKVLEYTSFPWMKRHQALFELSTLCACPVLKSGAMIRKGEAGQARSDGMTPAIADRVRQVGAMTCPDPAALEWFYTGGPLP